MPRVRKACGGGRPLLVVLALPAAHPFVSLRPFARLQEYMMTSSASGYFDSRARMASKTLITAEAPMAYSRISCHAVVHASTSPTVTYE